jgi:hypothetical protein
MFGLVQEDQDWYADTRIDVPRSEERLKTFLSLRKADKFKAFQTYLAGAAELIDPDVPPSWMDEVTARHAAAIACVEQDFAKRFERPIKLLHTLSSPERAMFWREHPEHAWYAFGRENWMQAAAGEPLLEKLH